MIEGLWNFRQDFLKSIYTHVMLFGINNFIESARIPLAQSAFCRSTLWISTKVPPTSGTKPDQHVEERFEVMSVGVIVPSNTSIAMNSIVPV